MTLIYAVIWGFMLMATLSAVAALAWAIRGGQLSDPKAAALSIFDPDELEDMAARTARARRRRP